MHMMALRVGQQIHDGDNQAAMATLQNMHHVAFSIHKDLSSDTRRLKETEQMIGETSRYVANLQNSANVGEQQALHATTEYLDLLQTELMLQVFRH
jgi:hypothetical protein